MAIVTEEIIEKKYKSLSKTLNEKSRRLWGATEAIAYGWGGIAAVSRATGLSNKTIHIGIIELKNGPEKELKPTQIRRSGGGRKKLTETSKMLKNELNSLVDPVTRGDPESALLWTSKSLQNLSYELNNRGYKISHQTVGRLLKSEGYSLQSNRKRYEGNGHVDRDPQFDFIHNKVNQFLKSNQPIISVDTKKKELLGNFKNNGKEWVEKGKPIEVNAYEFPSFSTGKVAPYGVYDLGKNKGWVSVGISKDTAEFSVNTIRTWWDKMGQDCYKNATELLITADCGGSNGNRVKLWKRELQKLANDTQLEITVSHFPPGTSKWNKIEHRLFSYISKNWRGKPLINTETVINLIKNTRTKNGLKVMAVLDSNVYKTGIKVSKKDMDALNIFVDTFHPEWNYTIRPNLS